MLLSPATVVDAIDVRAWAACTFEREKRARDPGECIEEDLHVKNDDLRGLKRYKAGLAY